MPNMLEMVVRPCTFDVASGVHTGVISGFKPPPGRKKKLFYY
jgi:hypothetical protein